VDARDRRRRFVSSSSRDARDDARRDRVDDDADTRETTRVVDIVHRDATTRGRRRANESMMMDDARRDVARSRRVLARVDRSTLGDAETTAR